MNTDSDEIISIGISLLVDEKQSLLILVAKDGAINRMGSGLADEVDRRMFVGQTGQAVFLRLRARVTPGVEHFLGQRVALPKPLGKICELSIYIKRASKHEAVSAWRYGSESQGPHPEIRAFVLAAVEETEPWFRNFRQAGLTSRAG